ncbi:hypothetical protein [Lampropedia puyangensis]|nr:hypothetical protein [Lampropedia puyangensis]
MDENPPVTEDKNKGALLTIQVSEWKNKRMYGLLEIELAPS